MSVETVRHFAAGLITLGAGFIILDFFLARLAHKLKRPSLHDLTDQQMLISVATPQERHRRKFAVINYEAAITHRMRRGGLIALTIGLVILVGSFAFAILINGNA